jgi:hypothetical protein
MKDTSFLFFFALMIIITTVTLMNFFGKHVEQAILTDSVTVVTDTVTVRDTVLIYIKGKIKYITEYDTVRIAETNVIEFTSKADTIITGDSYIDSIMVEYSYPSNMFKIQNKLQYEEKYIKETQYITQPRIVSLKGVFGVNTNTSQQTVGIGCGIDYKNMFDVVLVGNTNKEIGLQVGVPIRRIK